MSSKLLIVITSILLLQFSTSWADTEPLSYSSAVQIAKNKIDQESNRNIAPKPSNSNL